jgi:acyl-CoA synthetase (AMP-forming)/AMP-acid ligase II
LQQEELDEFRERIRCRITGARILDLFGAAMAHLSDLAAAVPGKPAVITADGSRVITYRQLDARSRQVSRLLAGYGIGPRDHIAILMVNRPEYFEVAWGAQRRGVYWTPVNWHLTADEAG